MVATKEAILAKEHEKGIDVTVFFMDIRAFGKDFDRYYERAKKLGVKYVRCRPSLIEEISESRNLRIGYMTENNKFVTQEFDMAVLSLGLEPSKALLNQAKQIGIELNKWGFAKTDELTPLDTTKPGIFVGGVFQEPKDIPETVMQASGAAAKAMTLLASVRGNLIRKKSYPPERDITDESPRIGVFVCHCGSNIASVVDVKKVVEHAATLPDVKFAEHAVYVCADNNQDIIKQRIIEHNLNRVVIASCTPRTHEPIFRDTLREVGLNQYLLEMANIRDQCSWVHSDNPDLATKKAMDLVRMIVGRSRNLTALKEETVPVHNSALVIGGGIAGMTTALALNDQGFPVHLVEKESFLGGTTHQIYRTIGGQDVQAFLNDTIAKVTKSKNITVHLNSRVTKVGGHIGEFSSIIVDDDKKTTEIEHGVVIVATGAEEKKPTTFGYGKSEKVITQTELSEKIAKQDCALPEKGTVVMIQCVEQRTKERPYCSRVCCATAVKNAIALKTKQPKLNVIVLYRDMRTYGFHETKYQEARAKGVIFMRYEDDKLPELNLTDNVLLTINEMVSDEKITIEPDMVVLSAPIVPRATRTELSELLRVPLNEDGFFLEAHVKLRPVDFASEGVFLCGSAHAPKFLKETISQANAVAARAATVLSKKALPVSGQIAWVDQDKCISCMTCVHVCPYNSPRINLNNKAEVQTAVCMGCGSCTSECPAKAITLRHYTDQQICGAIDNLLQGHQKNKEVSKQFPEQVGIAQPRWNKG
jgi:heterodisulfide reductase subunit A